MNADSRDEIRRTGFAAFHNRNFSFFWVAQITGGLAIEMQATAVSWQVWKMTEDPLALGMVGLAQILPFFFLFIISGMAADRLPRNFILAACYGLQALCGAAFLTITVTGVATFPMMFLILIGLGIARSFQLPAGRALVPHLVKREQLSNAVAWQTTGGNSARIGGPFVGGLLLIIGIPVAYAVAVGLSVIAVIMLLPLRLNTQIYSKEPITIPNLLAGLRFVFTRKVILGLVSLDFFVVLVGGVRALLPIFATDILLTDQAGYGILRSAETVGSLACFLLLTHLPVRRRAGDKMLLTVVLYGCGIIVFGLSTNFTLSYAALFFMGATDAISMFIRQNVVLLVSPDDLRGRINAVNSVFTSSSGQIGEFESGVTAAIFSTVPAVLIGGVGSIAIALCYAKLFPALRSIDSLDPDDLVRRFGNQDVAPDAKLQTNK